MEYSSKEALNQGMNRDNPIKADQLKVDQLAELRCRCMEELKDVLTSEQKVIFGEGPDDARMMLIGEAPGEQETRKGKPFVGQAGKNLDRFLEIMGMSRGHLYITNVVKFRPYRRNERSGRLCNRPPNKQEIQLCAQYLLEEIRIIEPDILVTLGNVPLQLLFGPNARIGDIHGRLLEYAPGKQYEKERKYKVFCLYHPASILYRRELEQVYYADLLKLKEVWNRLHTAG